MRKRCPRNGYVSELVHKHVGKAAVVIGGAPSRLTDVLLCPWDAVFISANDHGCKQRQCDYIAACEDLGDRLFSHGVPVISGLPIADYRVFDIPLPNSAALGAWIAWVMGCAPIVIAGVECYQGNTYPDDPKLRTSGHTLNLQEHLHRWSRLPKSAPGGQFRAITGPLLQLFPLYDPEEANLTTSFLPEAEKASQGTFIEFKTEIAVMERTYKRGEIAQVTATEERWLARNHPGTVKRL